MSTKPSIPKGTRDFSPAEMQKRDFIFNVIRRAFRLFGYQPIETPAMENLSTLLGKYGEEGDRLLFRILNSGDFLSALKGKDLMEENPAKTSLLISEKGLRYDLTVPFARYVVQHRNEIVFPFRRYQIQPVWRADRPQKGRYREFYQCDADVIGSDSLVNEAELIWLIDRIFSELNIRVAIKLNNRKILSGLAEIIGAPDKIIDITVAIDKLEKVGFAAVTDELKAKGLSERQIDALTPVLQLEGTNEEKLEKMAQILATSEEGRKGIDEVAQIFRMIAPWSGNNQIELDLTLARGLNYYTGAIIEVKALDVEFGSICGGGRYDDLTGIFGLPGTSGVGISFGADRIYDVLTVLNGFPADTGEQTKALIVHFPETLAASLALLNNLRAHNISVEFFPDDAKLRKQFSYANDRKIPFVIIAGQQEIESGMVKLKDMNTGEEMPVNHQELIEKLS